MGRNLNKTILVGFRWILDPSSHLSPFQHRRCPNQPPSVLPHVSPGTGKQASKAVKMWSKRPQWCLQITSDHFSKHCSFGLSGVTWLPWLPDSPESHWARGFPGACGFTTGSQQWHLHTCIKREKNLRGTQDFPKIWNPKRYDSTSSDAYPQDFEGLFWWFANRAQVGMHIPYTSHHHIIIIIHLKPRGKHGMMSNTTDLLFTFSRFLNHLYPEQPNHPWVPSKSE